VSMHIQILLAKRLQVASQLKGFTLNILYIRISKMYFLIIVQTTGILQIAK